ncbi:large subunit ribosomal protein L6e, partial [Phenoliferia sp. Uapishka_3]
MARNQDVAPHVGKLSRSALFSKKGLYKRKHAAPAAAPAEAATTVTKTIGGKANGTTRVLPVTRAPAFYPSEDVRAPKLNRKTLKPTKLRSTITPGTVLILLAGRFRGKRVVFLKQLEGGLLLVTGPFKINGVPVRRVNQTYCIATSTKVDLAGLEVDAKFNDAYFAKPAAANRAGTEASFFKDGEKKVFPAEKAADQKNLDKAVLAAVAKTPNLAKYLGATFGLTNGQYPHLLKF